MPNKHMTEEGLARAILETCDDEHIEDAVALRAQLAAERERTKSAEESRDGIIEYNNDLLNRAEKAESEAKALIDKAIEYALGADWISDSNNGDAIAFRAALTKGKA
jgi:hypothetical protein